MKQYIYGGALTLLFMGAMLVPNVHAETTTSSVESMLAQIKVLMAKVEELQKQLSTAQGELKAVIREGVGEGMEGDDIKKIQELLSTDTSIYPEGKVTGYFGPMTKEAIKRLQKRHNLEVTGVIDDTTRILLEEYLKERFGDKIPAGLLRAPGIAKKMEDRIKNGCNESKGASTSLFCKKEVKMKVKNDDKTAFEVEIEGEDGETTLSFTLENADYTVTLESTDVEDVLDAVAEELDTEVENLVPDLVYMIKKELKKFIADLEDAEDEADETFGDAQEALEDTDGDAEDAQESVSFTCPTTETVATALPSSGTGSGSLKLRSGQIKTYILPTPVGNQHIGPRFSGIFKLAENPDSFPVAPWYYEVHINKCKGLVEETPGDACYTKSANAKLFLQRWATKPFDANDYLNFSTFSGIGSRYDTVDKLKKEKICYTPPEEGPWYINVRYNYAGCNKEGGVCGWAALWTRWVY